MQAKKVIHRARIEDRREQMGSEMAAPGGAHREDAPFRAAAPSSNSPDPGGAPGAECRAQAGRPDTSHSTQESPNSSPCVTSGQRRAQEAYRHTAQLLLHLLQLLLLCGGGIQRGGIAALQPVHLDGRLRDRRRLSAALSWKPAPNPNPPAPLTFTSLETGRAADVLSCRTCGTQSGCATPSERS